MATIICEYCGQEAEAQRTTKRFCDETCARRKRNGWPKVRVCRAEDCEESIVVRTSGDANRQYCSKQCAKRQQYKNIRTWQMEHPEKMSEYRENQLRKNPLHHQERWQKRRGRILDLLGGKCVVCGVDNPYWLHVDFIPTTRNSKYRHPRHYKYIKEHQEFFRLLCANHHYELTLTGRIEGTDIIQ